VYRRLLTVLSVSETCHTCKLNAGGDKSTSKVDESSRTTKPPKRGILEDVLGKPQVLLWVVCYGGGHCNQVKTKTVVGFNLKLKTFLSHARLVVAGVDLRSCFSIVHWERGVCMYSKSSRYAIGDEVGM
jgi:hypothetical protein